MLGLGFGIPERAIRRAGSAAPAGGVSAPVLTRTSSAGAVPQLVSVAGDSTVYAGMWIHFQRASDSGFTTAIVNYYAMMDGASWDAGDEAYPSQAPFGLPDYVEPSGTYFERCRFETSPGDSAINEVGAWSNTITDSVSASVAAWNTATGVNKKSTMTVSGTPALAAQGVAAGGQQAVRATIEAQADYTQFEFTVTALNSGGSDDIWVGWCNTIDNFNPAGASPRPGFDNANGVSFNFNAAFGIAAWKNSATQIASISGSAGAVANGDVFTLRLKKSTGQIELHRTRSGVTTQLLAPTASGVTLASNYAFINEGQNESLLFNFGASAFSKALSAGAVIYG